MSQSNVRVERQSRKTFIGVLLLAFVAFLARGALATETDASSYADNELHKENEFSSLAKRPAFFVGSRYGRSSGNGNGGAASGMGTSKTRRLIIVPRNDRFFLGSRYGKRSNEYLSPYEQSSLGLGLDMGKSSLRDAGRSVESDGSNEKPSSRSRTNNMMTMSCIYTGIRNFYRCSDEVNNLMNHSEGMPLESNSIAAGEESDNRIK